jgi:excisionase family DNA binding protein
MFPREYSRGNMEPREDHLLTIIEASKMLGYTPQHTRLLLRMGRLRGTKLGRDWMLTEGDVLEFTARRSSIALFRRRARV